MKNLVIKKDANLFFVEAQDGEILPCVARKTLKKDGIFVGDRVILDGDNAINAIEKRKNLLVRPPLSNIDKMFIVIAPVPKPDLYTVDKLLIFCALNSITPVICINKEDLNPNTCQDLAKIYQKIVKTLIFSSFDQSVLALEKEIDGICVLAGQSAVGKSSIINALSGKDVAKVDTFSKRTQRGKQTTRAVQLYKFSKGYLADTAGFSKLDERLLGLEADQIKNYYPDFLPFAAQCRYKSCLHLSGDCAVCSAEKDGQIDSERYKNYVKLVYAVKNLKKY